MGAPLYDHSFFLYPGHKTFLSRNQTCRTDLVQEMLFGHKTIHGMFGEVKPAWRRGLLQLFYEELLKSWQCFTQRKMNLEWEGKVGIRDGEMS